MPDLLLPFNGERLWNLRERSGLTRAVLAAKCKGLGHPVTERHIVRLEKGESMPSPPLLLALVAALGVELDDLLDGDAA